MEAKELGLFNLLEVDGVIIEIGKIEEKHITWKLSKSDTASIWNPYLPVNDKRIKPIPLTEEWAVKFGYECLVEMACDFSGNYNVEITYNELKKLYVHQAQNLYFSLTGKELTLKQ